MYMKHYLELNTGLDSHGGGKLYPATAARVCHPGTLGPPTMGFEDRLCEVWRGTPKFQVGPAIRSRLGNIFDISCLLGSFFWEYLFLYIFFEPKYTYKLNVVNILRPLLSYYRKMNKRVYNFNSIY